MTGKGKPQSATARLYEDQIDAVKSVVPGVAKGTALRAVIEAGVKALGGTWPHHDVLPGRGGKRGGGRPRKQPQELGE